jgi:hypothetical protein
MPKAEIAVALELNIIPESNQTLAYPPNPLNKQPV